ncbi:MAG: thioredoxin reductase, partial [Rhodospirillaceae bacterium]|nr:thioredoxin reductase [Rhodospirillaceae bacterium]
MVAKRRHEYDVLILGGGLAGLMALSRAVQYGLSTALLEPGLFGGQVATVTSVEGYPAVAHPISGADLAASLLDSARDRGGDIIEDAALAIQSVGRQYRVAA